MHLKHTFSVSLLFSSPPAAKSENPASPRGGFAEAPVEHKVNMCAKSKTAATGRVHTMGSRDYDNGF